MNAPTEFNGRMIKGFGDEIISRIGLIEGVVIQRHGGNYDEKEFTMKIKFTLANPALESLAQKTYNRRRHHHGLPEWGFTFTDFDKGEWCMVDYKPRSPKFPIIAANENGTKYKFSVGHILRCLTNKEN